MDSYLSGREQVGKSSKKKELPQLGSSPLENLVVPAGSDAETGEVCGEGGSQVSYVTEDGRITKIVVTCTCGQVTEVDCKYDV